MQLVDSYGRKINYLRLSVTDRCNLRCSYCMPAGGVPALKHHEILSYEELLQVSQAAVALGVEKIRITGGEPLVRKGIAGFLRELGGIEGLRHLVLTTNGLLLAEMVDELRAAGVQRLNISLDSLRDSTFTAITRGGDLRRVLAGIAAAEKAGIPLKLNMVVMRGVNDDELLDFAAMTLDRPLSVRFIEYMPAAGGDGWRSLLVPGGEILSRIATRFKLVPVFRDSKLTGPARNYKIEGAAGMVGVITPVSGHFCAECNRIRVTSSGMAKSCLFGSDVEDLKPIIRSGDMALLEATLRRLVGCKPQKHPLSETNCSCDPFAMSRIGG